MYTKVLIPLDGSMFAEKVLPFARILAGALKLPIELLEVVDISVVTAHIAADKARYIETIIAAAEQSSREYLDACSTSLSGFQVSCRVERGRPADVIIDQGAADEGTLIAMATHGRSGINRWMLGSVAEKVLRGTKNPLLLVRANNEEGLGDRAATIKSIVVPLDGSALAESVLPTVSAVAKALDVEIVLCRVFELAASAYYGKEDYLPNYDEMLRQLKVEVESYLAAEANGLQAAGLKASWVALEGSGAEEIIRYAHQHPEALVAMCTHGRSGVSRWVLGSVTEKVVRYSGNPVLVFHAS